MDQAIEDYDEEHARGDPPQTVVSRRLTLGRKVINSLPEFNEGWTNRISIRFCMSCKEIFEPHTPPTRWQLTGYVIKAQFQILKFASLNPLLPK